MARQAALIHSGPNVITSGTFAIVTKVTDALPNWTHAGSAVFAQKPERIAAPVLALMMGPGRCQQGTTGQRPMDRPLRRWLMAMRATYHLECWWRNIPSIGLSCIGPLPCGHPRPSRAPYRIPARSISTPDSALQLAT